MKQFTMISFRGSLARLECDLNFGVPVLAVLGFIYSLWASDYIFTVLDSAVIRFFPSEGYLICPIQSTYYLLSFCTGITLYYGFKTNDEVLINYWHSLKKIDCGLFITASIIPFFFGFSRFWPYTVGALIALAPGWYLITTVERGSIGMGLTINPISNYFEKLKRFHQGDEEENVKDDSGSLHLLAESTLRSWGFTRIFEIVTISPGIFAVIIKSNMIRGCYYYFWNSFCLTAAVGVCLILSIDYIWNLIPKEEKQTDSNTENKTEDALSLSK